MKTFLLAPQVLNRVVRQENCLGYSELFHPRKQGCLKSDSHNSAMPTDVHSAPSPLLMNSGFAPRDWA